MDIGSLCRHEIISVAADASVRDAADAMRRHHVGALVVTDRDEPGRALGLLTDRDLALEVLAAGRDPASATAGDLCHGPLVGVEGTASVQDAVDAMQRAGVRRLLVVQADGSLLGVISADDLLEAIAGELDTLAAALRTGIARESERTSPRLGRNRPSGIYLVRNEP